MSIAIIKYNAGNIRSVQIALERLGAESVVTDNPAIIRLAEKVIFPGVGEASSAMKYLKERKLDEVIRSLSQPVLGICLGLQLMCAHTEEADTKCLGIFDNTVVRFPDKDKVPHMGWNSIHKLKSPLFKGVENGSHVYFVHSYAAKPDKEQIAETNYIMPFASAFQKDNFYATQFHPEKSGDIGQQILKNFIEL